LLNNKVSLGILIALVITNATWGATSGHSGPLIALSFYAVVAFLCWRWSHFQAGIIAGVAGVSIHAYELISWGLAELRALEVALLFVNLILPILLIYFSYKAYREIGKMKEDDLKRLHL
jgi:hypothetical protein